VNLELGQIVMITVGVVNLLAIGAALIKGGKWAGTVDTTLKGHGEQFASIKATLGNGEPGTVVRLPVCQALHAGIAAQIGAAHEDIRSLHEAVRDLKGK
jgi:hypothetical protein